MSDIAATINFERVNSAMDTLTDIAEALHERGGEEKKAVMMAICLTQTNAYLLELLTHLASSGEAASALAATVNADLPIG